MERWMVNGRMDGEWKDGWLMEGWIKNERMDGEWRDGW